jgi:hypothetical protein
VVTRRRSPASPARKGKAARGRAIDPGAQPPQPDMPRAAPSHGTPISPQALKRLKRRARDVPPAPGGPAQDEDKDS